MTTQFSWFRWACHYQFEDATLDEVQSPIMTILTKSVSGQNRRQSPVNAGPSLNSWYAKTDRPWFVGLLHPPNQAHRRDFSSIIAGTAETEIRVFIVWRPVCARCSTDVIRPVKPRAATSHKKRPTLFPAILRIIGIEIVMGAGPL